MEKKLFPLHSTGRMIPWGVAERAYEVYSKRYGSGQSLERLAQRGGFSAGELDEFYPGWREEVEEIYLLRKEVERLTAERDLFKKEMAALAKDALCYKSGIETAVGRLEEIDVRSGGTAWLKAKELMGSDLFHILSGLQKALAETVRP